MSLNLYLKTPRSDCSLLQTPTVATNRIYRRGDSRHETLMRYFRWLEEDSSLPSGALLDHKLSVALFLVENPDAVWGAS